MIADDGHSDGLPIFSATLRETTKNHLETLRALSNRFERCDRDRQDVPCSGANPPGLTLPLLETITLVISRQGLKA
jgi:hypothetical protein